MNTVAIFSVVAVVFNEHGHVLSVSRRHDENDLGLPGGKIEPGETPEAALERELFEETGLRATRTRIVFEHLDRVEKGQQRPCRAFLVDAWMGEPLTKEKGVLVQWVPFSRLLDSRCSFRAYNELLLSSLFEQGIVRS